MTVNTHFSWNRAVAMALFAGALMILGASNAWSERNQNPGVSPPNSHPYGTTYPEWAGDWFEWIVSIPEDQNPFLDPDGRFCQVGQSAPVFFLGSNTGGDTMRSCTVPTGQAILFSPGGSFCILDEQTTEDDCRAIVEEQLSLMSNVSADIDGKPLKGLESYRFISGLVTVALPANNIFQVPAGLYQAINGGYFLIHSPLPPGQHVIHFHDEITAYEFVSDVTYKISVGKDHGKHQ